MNVTLITYHISSEETFVFCLFIYEMLIQNFKLFKLQKKLSIELLYISNFENSLKMSTKQLFETKF